uniref:Glutathione hydrolase n=1 Tax=Apteryx owenii TaxID=8824 RepID=A0A8B9PWA8_APTOW
VAVPRYCSACIILPLGIQGGGGISVLIKCKPRKAHCGRAKGLNSVSSFLLSFLCRDILKSGGTAVDAAIAALICTSVMNPQSSGLGGGVIFTIYNASTGTVEVINARETVPRVSVLLGMTLSFCSSGPHWIAVPGEIRGYEEAHKRYGRLPWKSLFEPTIKLLSEPLVISPVMDKIMSHKNFSEPGQSLCPLLCEGRRFLNHGETFRWPALQRTLRAVAENGASAFYEGPIGKALVEDLRKAESNISLEDLKAYKAEVSSALNITLNNYTVFSPGPPMGGAVLLFILKILEGKFIREKGRQEEKVENYHLIAEALKFGNMQKPHMSDPAFSDAQVSLTLLSDKIAKLVRSQIDDRGDHPLSHYQLLESTSSHRYKTKGTTHISVLAADGSAVSATSTINYPFGSFVYSNQTGIILNNELADFCIANRSIKPGEHSHPQNKKQGEKPPSAMVPSILVTKTGDMLVIGGAGGSWIISATAIINKLWLGYDLEHAIAAPIMHTEGDEILFETHFSEEVRSGLLRRGHKEKKVMIAMNVVQGISKEGKCISAYSDIRKLGKSAGY